MQSIDGRIVYSATDLVGFVECGHLADLERAAAEGHLEKPMREDKVLDRIAQRGLEHEARFLRDLDGAGRGVRDLTIPNDSPLAWPERVREHAGLTVEAMRDGVDVIYQATFFDGGRLGFVDFLRRVETPSPTFGAWSYEVWDTKLARHAKASAVLQLCFYSDMLTTLQGVAPESMHLALGGKQQEKVTFRVADYAAYYRSVARDLEVELGGSEVFPVISMAEPVEHCEVCRWSERCSREWRERDDLSLVAGITSRQRRALHAADVPTRTGLASLDLPTPARLPEINAAALERIQKQAEIQVRGERAHATIFELIDPTLTTRDGTIPPNYGLAMLPPPSPGDLFFDIEGDPFFGTDEIDGIDYLFGVIEPGRRDAAGQPMFHDFWAIEDGEISPALERRAFEAFIDLVMERLRQDPGLHVYHYAPYEPTAVKRLAGRYGTREDEVDTLLRGNVFVDLYRAVRQGIRASVESYSIKKLEPLYSFTRDVAMRDANTIIVEFETWLELGGDPARALAIIGDIRAYNRDDCVSTWRLRDWLEVQRTALEAQLGQDIPRAHYEVPEERELSETRQATVELVTRLTSGLPDDLGEANDAERGRWLLAQLLDWHRREEKSTWWRYFSLAKDYTDEERRDLPDTLGCLEATGEIGKVRKSTIYRFSFPPQEHKFSVGDAPHDPLTFKGAGTIEAINDETGTIDIARSSGSEAPTPTSLIPLDIVRAAPKPEALNRLADWVLDHGIEAVGEHRAGRDLLMRVPPRLGQQAGAPLAADGEDIQAAARRLVMGLDASYLAIQGPPGSGKSSVGAQMIVDLVAAGKRVGVTANSHKVIGELLQKVDTVAAGRGVAVQIGHRNDEPPYAGARVVSNNEARSGLADGTLDVVGGTAWLWAREEMARSVDVLFIDEAGQMSLADALAASTGADSLVLLGDPQQLAQVTQGTHPPGAGGSALAHLLGSAATMPLELGLFLDGTWRLHPAITRYTSEVFYDGKLRSHPGREEQDVRGVAPFSGTGIRFVRAEHERNSSDAPEEAAQIAAAIRSLHASKPTWTDASGVLHGLDDADVLLITPYNAQVAALSAVLPGFRIGTVDKFQGQEAPISVYSMATSSPEEAPRGMEFLYSLNRLNVATSRAQCLAIVVASPGLLRVRCRTPRQMQLVNALARLVELASE